MDKRDVGKAVVKVLVSTAVSSLTTKVLLTNIPATAKFKAADMAGMFAGWYVIEKYELQLDKIVDDFFDKRENR
jgi:hypothetical protein